MKIVTHKGNAKGNLHFLYALQFLPPFMNGISQNVKTIDLTLANRLIE
jgi:hypothetical protein